MKTPTHILAIIILLLLIDIGCIIIMRKEPKKQVDSIDQAEIMEEALAFAYTSFFYLDAETIEKLLVKKKLESVLEGKNQLFLFIPDSPCDVCINHQLMLIEKEYVPSGKKITLLVPNRLRKSILAKMGEGLEKVSICCYDSSSSLDEECHDDIMLLFFVYDHRIVSYYAINKNFGEATSIFLTSINNKY